MSHTQDSLADKILQRGDIKISLEHGINYSFDNVPFPLKQANTIMRIRDKHLMEEEMDEVDNDKFDILVETLGEVIQDYMGTRKKQRIIHDMDELDKQHQGMFD